MSPRLRYLVSSFLIGVMGVGLAWAGSVLAPPPPSAGSISAPGTGLQARQEGDGGEPSSLDLSSGQLLAGAAKISLYPRPEDYQADFPDARWEQDQAKCETLSRNPDSVREGLSHAGDTRVRWHENPNCIYMGGYGIGPMNAITKWDDAYGLWVRSIAVSDGSDAAVITLIDAVYWEAYYDSLCPNEQCGFLALADQLAQTTGLKPESFIFASTHSHTAPDFIGGWGGVPRWYMQQATDTLKAAAIQAIQNMEPAVLEVGEEFVRDRSGERRDFYRSAEDNGLSWFRLIDADNQPRPEACTTPTPTPEPTTGNNGNGQGNRYGNQGKATPAPAPTPICEPAAPGRAIATVGAYAAHPVTEDESGGEGDADFPAVFSKNVESAFGGVGMLLQTGLGNISPRGNKDEMGNGLASHIPPIGDGDQVMDTNVRVGRTFWDQPVTNVPLGHLGAVGIFDRTFNKTPAALSVGKSKFENRKCRSASHVSVETSVSAVRIGSLLITGGPGELFSNLTNTIEEKNPNGVTLALGLVNDGLGYIVQSFETDHVGRQAVGFVGEAETPEETPVVKNGVGAGLSEYEDAYSIDHCFGDATLEYTLNLIGQL